MHMVGFILLSFTILVDLVLILIIKKSGRNTPVNIIFLGILFSIICWALGSTLMLYADDILLVNIGIYLFMVSPLFVSLLILFFSFFFPDQQVIKKSQYPLFALFTLPTIVLGTELTIHMSHYVRLVSVSPDINYIAVFPPYNGVYSSYFTLYFIAYSIQLIRKFLQNKGILRKRIFYLMVALIAATIVALVFNLLIPEKTHNLNLAWVGPLSSTFLSAATIFAIIRYSLFDVRMVVVRLLVYITSLSVILIIFSVVAFVILTPLVSSTYISVEAQLAYSFLALLIAVSFSSIKSLIDRFTNKLFFQQKYSVHETLNKISTYNTKNIDVDKIELFTLKMIRETIQPEYGVFVIYKNEDLVIQNTVDSLPVTITSSKSLLNNFKHVNQKTILKIEPSKHQSLTTFMEANRVGAIVRLKTSDKVIGFLLLGDRKNGANYNGHDLQLLDLVANDLALALQNAQRYEEIKAFNETLQAKINDATKALKRTNAKLIALDDAKDEFISMASHQLRTPLTSVKGYISMLLEEDLGKINENQKQALKEAFDSSQRMVFLISDFLNVSRMRTGKFLLESKETDLTQIVTEEIQQLKEMAALREQVVVYTPPKKFPIVMLDENKIRQVMMNILDNAIFYTPRNGKITITLESTKDEIIYKVTDEGIGVPEKEQHRLFTKFFRAENARKARPDGTGLGLFMAQKVITEQGGSIIFKSKLGEGSTFGFRFPLEKVRATVDKK